MAEQNLQHQQQQSRQLYSKIFKNGRFHKSHIEILTFLKSNYKYKRRNYTTTNAFLVQPETALSTRIDATCSKCTAATFDVASEKTFCCHQQENITQKLKTKSDNFLLKLINLSLVVVLIVAKFLYHKLMSSLWSPSALIPPSDFVQFTSNCNVKKRNITNFSNDDDTSLHNDDDDVQDDVNVKDFNESYGGDFIYENDDIDGDNFVTISDNNNHDVDEDSDETCCQRNYDKLSTLGCQQQRRRRLPLQHNLNEWLRHQWISLLQLLRRGSASSSSSSSSPLLLSVEIHTQVKSIFMTLFIALALSIRCVEGGACWQKTLYNGKCNEIFSLNITKAECCGTNLEFSYTDRELTSVEYFFATAIGGGMECAPCLESCKNVNCGPNKKCAKRKGRLKCICAPECGAATRRRQRLKLFKGATQPHQHPHHHHHHHHHHNSESMFNPVQRNLETAVIFGKSARDIRSLSSEIQNQNLGLKEEDEENLSQRKHFIMQSGEVEVGIGGQSKSPMKGGVEITKRKMLLIVETRGQQHEDKPTTRRLQVISNTNNKKHNHHGNKRKQSTKLHEQNPQEKVEKNQSKNNRDASSATALAAATTSTALQPRFRHKFNANNNNKNMQQQQQQQTKNFDAKLRHIHQNFRQQLELEDTPNHHDQQQHHGRHHQFRKRKKKLHNKLKQDQLDDVKNADNATTVVATMSGTRTIITTTSSASTTSTTPVNSSVTQDQRLLNHGSNSATSSSSRLASSSSSSSASASLSGSGELTNVGVGGSSSSSFSHHRTVNSDDMTFDDRIYNKFNMHGFPGQEQQRMTQIAKSHSSHHPVCGTDGRTYNTECQLKKRSCRTDNTELVVAYHGHCKTTCNGVKCLNGLTCVEDHYTIPHCIACKIDCPVDDDNDDEIDASRAVCGVDGKTYKSVCDINRMICKIGRSIAVAYPGPCRDDRVTCSDINCGPKRKCLMDLLTHEPRCVSCRYKCSRKRRPAALRYEEGKICGVNNRTYHSWCEMRKDSCVTGFYIDVKSFGECD